MASGVKDVMIALHPPSLDRCKEVVDAWYPPPGSDDHICGCTEESFERMEGFYGKSESDLGFLLELWCDSCKTPTGKRGKTSNYVVEADDWKE